MEYKGRSVCEQNTYNGWWQNSSTAVSAADSTWHSYLLVATLLKVPPCGVVSAGRCAQASQAHFYPFG